MYFVHINYHLLTDLFVVVKVEPTERDEQKEVQVNHLRVVVEYRKVCFDSCGCTCEASVCEWYLALTVSTICLCRLCTVSICPSIHLSISIYLYIYL